MSWPHPALTTMKRTLLLVASALVIVALYFALRGERASDVERDASRSTRAAEELAASPSELERAPSAGEVRALAEVSAESNADSSAEDDGEDRPTIFGRVIDDAGEPAAGAAVFAAPCGRMEPRAGPWSVAPCDAGGRFTVELQRDAPSWLWLDDGRYVPWHSWQNALDCVAPGVRDVVIRVQRVRTTQFRVVDARTGAPIEQVSVLVVYDRTPLPPGARVSGSVSWYADPFTTAGPLEAQPAEGFRVNVVPPARTAVVRAAGYATALAHFTDAAEHTLALERVGLVRGTLAFADGTPRPCSVELRRVSSGTRLDEARASTSSDADANGNFTVFALDPGVYDVFVRVQELFEDPKLLARKGVRVSSAEVTDLGRVDVDVQTADVTIQVFGPDGVDARELRREVSLSVDGWPAALEPTDDGAAKLRNRHRLPARSAECTFPARSHALAPEHTWRLQLAPGDANEFTLDLTSLPLCSLDVHVDKTALGGRKLVVVYADGSEHEHEIDVPQGEPFVQRVIARGGERVVVEHVTLLGEAVATSAPIVLPRTSVTPIEVHVR